MPAVLKLPTKTDELNDALDSLVQSARLERNAYQVGWWLTDAYVRGVRQFDDWDYEQGTLEASYEDEDGELHLRWDEPLTKIFTEIGRLTRLDTSPLCKKRAYSLESLRKSSLSQALLNNVVASQNMDKLKIQYFTGICLYGTYGFAAWPDDSFKDPLDFEFELIPPWELLGSPADRSNPSDERAITRYRLYPLSEVIAQARKKNKRVPAEDSSDWEVTKLPFGANVSASHTRLGSGTATAGGSHNELYDGRDGGSKHEARTESFVYLEEHFLRGPRGTLARYIRRAGRVIVEDTDFLSKGERIPYPLGIGRYEDTGHFYGRSLASKIIPLSLEIEHLLEKLIQNMADFDRFGFVMVPNNLGIDMENFSATEGPRIIPYEADPTNADIKPSLLTPASISDVPAKVMDFCLTLLDRIVQQGPTYQGEAPGRGDSGAFLNSLKETGSTHLLPVAENTNEVFTTVYRSILHNLRGRLKDDKRALDLSKIDGSLAGVKIDPATGQLLLEPHDIPNSWDVELSIKSKDPDYQARRRMEGYQMLNTGIITPLEFIILNYQEEWGFPVGNKSVWENYVKAVLVNLILFNDGIEPGELPGSILYLSSADKPDVQLLAMEDFMATAEFALSSEQVLNAFTTRINIVKAEMGQLPQGVPDPVQAAMQSQASPGIEGTQNVD